MKTNNKPVYFISLCMIATTIAIAYFIFQRADKLIEVRKIEAENQKAYIEYLKTKETK